MTYPPDCRRGNLVKEVSHANMYRATISAKYCSSRPDVEDDHSRRPAVQVMRHRIVDDNMDSADTHKRCSGRNMASHKVTNQTRVREWLSVLQHHHEAGQRGSRGS
jgi:hypothetical protein